MRSPTKHDEIEFTSDGVIDSVTRTMAPTLFVHQIYNSIAQRQRHGGAISLILIRCQPEITIQQLRSAARSISELMRGGELLCRMGEFGFWILAYADEAQAEAMVGRILKEGSEKPILSGGVKRTNPHAWIEEIDTVSWKPGERALDFISRADRYFFTV
jgi:GGDEF domain-containing protein